MGAPLASLSCPHSRCGTLVRKIYNRPWDRLEFTADSFNLFNRDDRRFTITSNGLTVKATAFTGHRVHAVQHLLERSSLPCVLPATAELYEAE